MKVKIYGKDQNADPPAIEFINDAVEHYCTNGMFYVKTKRNGEYYFALEVIAFISVEPESEEEQTLDYADQDVLIASYADRKE